MRAICMCLGSRRVTVAPPAYRQLTSICSCKVVLVCLCATVDPSHQQGTLSFSCKTRPIITGG
jgi:hypothetical protein